MEAVAGFDVARRISEQILENPDKDCAFISGSRVVGLGNSTSDIDLFIVTPNGRGRSSVPQQMASDEARIDVEQFTRDEMSAVAALVNSASGTRQVWGISRPDLDQYFRVSVGICVQNQAVFDEVVAEFDKERLAIVYAQWASLRATNRLQLAHQFAGRGSWLTAYLYAREAHLFTMEKLSAERGFAFPNPKWAFEKLRSAFASEPAVYESFWETKAPGASRSLHDHLRTVTALCDSFGIVATVSDLQDAWVSVPRRVDFVPKSASGYAILHRSYAYELNPAAWSVCASLGESSESISALVAKFASLHGISDDIARLHVLELLVDLEREGLIEIQGIL